MTKTIVPEVVPSLKLKSHPQRDLIVFQKSWNIGHHVDCTSCTQQDRIWLPLPPYPRLVSHYHPQARKSQSGELQSFRSSFRRSVEVLGRRDRRVAMVGVICCEQDNCRLHPPSYIDTLRLRYVTFFLSSILISLTSPTRTAPPIPCICNLRPSSSTRRSR